MKVLLVDDQADLRGLIRTLLGPEYEYLEAGTARDALRLVRRERPRLMLLDVGITRSDGLEVLRGARRLDPGLAVLMLTADRSLETARAALHAGARSYITKPFDPEALCDEVARLMEKGSSRVEASSGRPWRVMRGGGARL